MYGQCGFANIVEERGQAGVTWPGDGGHGGLVVDTEADNIRAGGEVCGILERAAGRVEFGIEYRHVPWEGNEVGANDRAGYVEVDEGCAHFAFGL